MKLPVFLIAAMALGACADSPEKKSVETPMGAEEALDIATATKVDGKTMAAAKAETRPDDAVCNRGTFAEERSFILCEDGALRKAGVMAALSAPHDPDLKIEEVAESYGIAPQVFTGIESATYGTLVNRERKPSKSRGKHRAMTGLVQIQGKVYEVYQVSADKRSGTVFVEQATEASPASAE